jgi:YcaO-like protein with predicted kinase domain
MPARSPARYAELGTPYGPRELLDGLRRDERVVYSQNGNRAVRGRALLDRLEALAPRLGITRVADISHLSPANYPVFQSCRPMIFSHPRFGQNSGAQGKGPSALQAKISCLMESIEGYCAEPKQALWIRGSYEFLKGQHAIADPRIFVSRFGTRPRLREPLMWTPALALPARTTVLIPAETVFYPMFTGSYDTRQLFPSSSNGLASGATYLEACIHGIYEVIERCYEAGLETGRCAAEALFEHEVELPGLQAFAERIDHELELQLYALELEDRANGPVILCLLIGGGRVFSGWGCSLTLDISLSRAISEAFQGPATFTSGAREDMSAAPPRRQPGLFKRGQPERRTLRLRDYRKRIIDRRFTSLNRELEMAIRWVERLGYSHIFIANLTRRGVDVPVVKVVVPGMPVPYDLRVRRPNNMLHHHASAAYPTITTG